MSTSQQAAAAGAGGRVREERVGIKIIDTSIEGWEGKGLLIRRKVAAAGTISDDDDDARHHHAADVVVEPVLIDARNNNAKAKGRYNLVSKLRRTRKELPELPGWGKVKKNRPSQNQELLLSSEMIGNNVSNDRTDGHYWNNPVSGENPAVPNHQRQLENVGREEGEEENQEGNMIHDWSYRREDENPKKRPRVVLETPKKKKPTSSSAPLVIRDQIRKVADESASSLSISKKRADVSIHEVMDLVLDCGADYGTNEHDIATQLFVNKDHRQMFLTFPTREIRFKWLTRRFHDKYGNGTI